MSTIPEGYCQCGCGQKTTIPIETNRKVNRIKGKPMRFIVGHATRRNVVERFWEKVSKRSEDECWEWKASKNTGYGQINTPHGIQLANRFSYELAYGPIPKGMYVCHHCDNRACVNPKHLFLGTPRDNTQDMLSKGRHIYITKHGAQNGNSKLTDEQVIQIREQARSGEKIRDLARKFNVSETTVSHIVNRKKWKHLP